MNPVHLSFPGASLSPNRRGHWRKHAGKIAAAKEEAVYASYEAGARTAKLPNPLHLRVEITPPDKHKYDRDNLQARCKTLLDGFALAIGQDDYTFRPEWVHHAPSKPGGVTITPIGGEDD